MTTDHGPRTKKITVTAKITAGVHPVHGAIVEGRTYEIDEDQFADQLFHPASPSATPGQAATDPPCHGVAGSEAGPAPEPATPGKKKK